MFISLDKKIENERKNNAFDLSSFLKQTRTFLSTKFCFCTQLSRCAKSEQKTTDKGQEMDA